MSDEKLKQQQQHKLLHSQLCIYVWMITIYDLLNNKTKLIHKKKNKRNQKKKSENLVNRCLS